jgi:hypothetical protein
LIRYYWCGDNVRDGVERAWEFNAPLAQAAEAGEPEDTGITSRRPPRDRGDFTP